MGQKVNPIGIRLGITKPYSSVWYASTANFPANIKSDFEVRKYLTQELKNASVSKIVIDRPAKSIRVTIHTARPGIVIGKKGEDVEKLRRKITEIAGVPAQVNISEVRKPDLDAKLVADSIASQLERRVMFRRAMKKAIQNAMRVGAKGIKVEVSGNAQERKGRGRRNDNGARNNRRGGRNDRAQGQKKPAQATEAPAAE